MKLRLFHLLNSKSAARRQAVKEGGSSKWEEGKGKKALKSSLQEEEGKEGREKCRRMSPWGRDGGWWVSDVWLCLVDFVLFRRQAERNDNDKTREMKNL